MLFEFLRLTWLFLNELAQKQLYYQSFHRTNIVRFDVHNINFYCEEMQPRFRIQSFSSQNDSFPIGNLISKHSHWESAKFCDYPQQITISFYQPIHISSIKIAAHSTKIPSRINILYNMPKSKAEEFRKYGYITFSEGNSSGLNPIQVKQLKNADIKAQQIRFIILQNHINKNNFYNQIAISQLSFTGNHFDHAIPSISPSNKSTLLGFNNQINLLNQLKANYVKREQFDEAKEVKQLLNYIDRANKKISELEIQKQLFVKGQDYDGAQKVKENIVQYKHKMTGLINHFYDPEKQMIRTIKTDTQLRQKIDELQLMRNSSFESSLVSQGNQSVKASRVKEELQSMKGQIEVVSQGQNEDDDNDEIGNQSIVNHEERIVPAVISRIKGLGQTQRIPQNSQIGDNQFFQQNNQSSTIPGELQTLSPSDEANSSILNQFYDTNFIQKLHSKYWQYKLESITKAIEEMKQNKTPSFLNKNRLRALIFIYCLTIKSNNYQIANSALEMMSVLVTMKPQGQYKTDLHNQLETAIKLTLKKLNDSNQKIKNLSQKTLLRIIQGSIFGVTLCYSTIIKSYSQKVNPKIRKIKIENIQYIVQKYGIGQNGVPHSVADFALKAANDPDSEVRKSAINLAKSVKQKGGKQRLQNLLLDSNDIKSSIAKQLSI